MTPTFFRVYSGPLVLEGFRGTHADLIFRQFLRVVDAQAQLILISIATRAAVSITGPSITGHCMTT
jgi:hypothetical protein